MTEPMRNDEQHHRGPCPVPTPAERVRVRAIIAAIRAKLHPDPDKPPS